MTDTITTPQGRRIAYHRSAGQGPGIVFLGGFKSDMEGSKALALEAWARAQGRAFLRFDYSGHGVSDGAFTDGAIGDWYEDARDLIMAVTSGPQVLVGSSMGGWISLLICREHPEKVAGLVTIAAAPDPAALPMPKPEGQRWVGTLAGLRPVKQLPALVEACAALPPEWHLVICGEGPERAAILAEAEARGIAARVWENGAIRALLTASAPTYGEAFAEVWRLQQTVDELFVSLRRLIRNEVSDFFF